MKVYENIISRKQSISVIGLGYVGLPLAIEFAKITNVIGFDTDAKKVELLKEKKYQCDIVDIKTLEETDIIFTSDEKELNKSVFHIIAVPTPINKDKTPDLKPLETACKLIGKNIKKGDYVVFESTVYPGVTENFCIPILEEKSGYTCGKDFKVGYSPERINPGDAVNTVTKITKVVSGIDNDALNEIAKVYELIITAGVYKANSIKVAEASKAIENAQRDINIAFMNEMAKVFDKMDIDTNEVLKASSTKWNFLNFTPGLVGGHCIGVDPYYLIYMFEQLSEESQVIAAGRRTNESMGKFIGHKVIELIAKEGKKILGANVLILGFAFKENISDVRNTKVVDIVKTLDEFSVNSIVVDPLVNKEDVYKEYQIDIKEIDDIRLIDAIVWAVPHNCFKKLDLGELKERYCNENCVLLDVKNTLEKTRIIELGLKYWNL